MCTRQLKILIQSSLLGKKYTVRVLCLLQTTRRCIHRQSHLRLSVDGLLLQRQGELVLLVGHLLTLHLPGDTSRHTHTLAQCLEAPLESAGFRSDRALLPAAGHYLCDGEGLLLGVLAHTDHEQNLGGEQQAAGVLLARPAHDDHLQRHVELRPPQRLEHLPAVPESPHTEAVEMEDKLDSQK